MTYKHKSLKIRDEIIEELEDIEEILREQQVKISMLVKKLER